jgi:hypothetical protein
MTGTELKIVLRAETEVLGPWNSGIRPGIAAGDYAERNQLPERFVVLIRKAASTAGLDVSEYGSLEKRRAGKTCTGSRVGGP